MNIDDFSNMLEAIEFIKFLDNDKNAYLAMLNEPLILDRDFVLQKYKQLAIFLCDIFTAESPFRRGFGQWRMNLEKRYVRFQKVREATNKIVHLYRRAIFLRFWKKLFTKKKK